MHQNELSILVISFTEQKIGHQKIGHVSTHKEARGCTRRPRGWALQGQWTEGSAVGHCWLPKQTRQGEDPICFSSWVCNSAFLPSGLKDLFP